MGTGSHITLTDQATGQVTGEATMQATDQATMQAEQTGNQSFCYSLIANSCIFHLRTKWATQMGTGVM